MHISIASLSSLSLRRLTRPSHLFHPTSPPPAMASLFWAAPTAFLDSSSGSQPLVEQILGHPPGPSPHICSALSALASAAVHPYWQSLDDIDVPLRQYISTMLLSSACSPLHPPSAPELWPTHPICLTLGTGSTWYLQPPWASISRTVSFSAACATG